jgi:hypothetical protein
LNNENKNQFKEMLDTVFDIYNKNHADQNLLRVWWLKLQSYDMNIVNQAFDSWTTTSNKFPTPHDIILLCRQKKLDTQVAKKIPYKSMSPEKRKEISEKLQGLIKKMRGVV